MRRAVALLAATLMMAGAKEAPTMHHATGTFAVAITQEAEGAAPAGGLPTARMGLVKTFAGALAGESRGTMLSAGVPGADKIAVYVAVDQFSGTLDGRRGGFVLLHRGTMSSGGNRLRIEVAPDSGTGALAGIEGTLNVTIDGGVHHYDLAYTLPG